LGRKAEAITTLAELQKSYPKSNYVKDAKALEIEVRGGKGPTPIGVPPSGTGPSGRPPSEEDCELKLLALNSMQHQDPEQAVPLLEKFLQVGSSSCPKLRKQALFVLAQTGSPRAREVIEKVARGQLVVRRAREPGGAEEHLRVEQRQQHQEENFAELHDLRGERIPAQRGAG
jgi:hypothetical protein